MARPVTDPPVTHEQRLTMSYDDYLAWSGEGRHGEWVDGEVIVLVPTKPPHQLILLFLSSLLSSYTRLLNPSRCSRAGLGVVLTEPCEMRLRPGGSSRLPDIVFVARAHLDRVTPDRVEGPADLVVELISEESVTRDRVDKFREYEAAGIPEYWLIDSRPGHKQAEFYRLGPDGRYRPVPPDAEGRSSSAVVAGFWLDPDWLWQDPLPEPAVLISLLAADAFAAARRTMRPESGANDG